jgi:hypothetical protein
MELLSRVWEGDDRGVGEEEEREYRKKEEDGRQLMLKRRGKGEEDERKMRLQAVVWSSLDGDTNALRLRLLSIPVIERRLAKEQEREKQENDEPNRLVHIVSRVPRQRVVQLRDELITVLLSERHERSAHDDELDLLRENEIGMGLK